MAAKVGLIGHCGPDSSYLRMAVSSAQKGVQIVSAESEEALSRLLKEGVDLLLFNRLVDYGFAESEGAEIIRRVKKTHPNVKMMLVSNYPEAQQAAVAAGALPGFGKNELGSPRVVELLRSVLGG